MQSPLRLPSWEKFPPNTEFFMEIIGAQRWGKNCLPTHLGLEDAQYEKLIQRYFSGIKNLLPRNNETDDENGQLRQQLLELRREEWQELRELLLAHRRDEDISEEWLASIIAAACLGSSHLWRDLGLSSRDNLKNLLFSNFPKLAMRNDKDMRWKKFLYKQLCEQGGHYVCRAPSCDVCPTYDECFGDES